MILEGSPRHVVVSIRIPGHHSLYTKTQGMSKDMGAYEAQIYVFNVSVRENRRKLVGNVLEFNNDYHTWYRVSEHVLTGLTFAIATLLRLTLNSREMLNITIYVGL